MATKTHEIHKYKRMSVGRKGHEIYKCMLPGCAHYLPYVELAIGRLSQCWGCNSPIELTQDMVGNLKTIRPVCENCKELRKAQRLALAAVPMSEDEQGDDDYET